MKKVALKIKETILRSQNIVITGHTSPDPDCLGACAALNIFLSSVKKKCYFVSKSLISDKYIKFFSTISKIYESPPVKPDLLIVCDTATQNRVDSDLIEKNIINIDHHISNEKYGSINLVSPTASSTCEIVFDLLKIWDSRTLKNSKVAEALVTGILFDTNFFKNISTSSNAFYAVSQLIDYTDYKKIVLMLAGMSKQSVWKFCNRFKTSVEVCKNRGLLLFIDKSDNGDWIADWIKNIIEYDFVAVAKKITRNKFRVSLRSKGFDVNKIAEKFNGGGHISASAFSFNGSKQNLIDALNKI